jgi:phosphoglucosamine mutase
MTLKFGTDGVRGVANSELTPELTMALGRAAARVLGTGSYAIGRDTRRSGPMLEAALVAGLCSEGASAVLLGVVPTPVVARYAQSTGAAGAMISASHNPFGDNGVKLFARGGRKLTDEAEELLEAELERIILSPDPAGEVPLGAGVGGVEMRGDFVAEYQAALLDALEGRRLDGMSVVLDCAHGSATEVAPALFARAGAEVVTIGAGPDGTNINDGVGSTAPEVLAAEVIRHRADLGLAFDGDADRLVAVADDGSVVDGDRLLCLFAVDLRARGRLPRDTLVVTVMSNVGLRLAMGEAGVRLVTTPVGDRYVLDELERGGFGLGGEQSGHIVFTELATTGDGLLSGLMLVDLVRRAGCPLSELAAAAMVRYPQVLLNVPVAERVPDVAERMRRELAAAERNLGTTGRVLLRPSGTEPVVRVMVEAEDLELAQAVAENLASEVARQHGRHPSR